MAGRDSMEENNKEIEETKNKCKSCYLYAAGRCWSGWKGCNSGKCEDYEEWDI